jgi:hypothetical protein
MKPFKNVTIVKYPLKPVWTTIRDNLPDLVPLMEDVEKIIPLGRQDQSDGAVRIDNLWQANPRLLNLIKVNLSPENLAWVDRSEWREGTYECHWRIEPRFLPEHIQSWGLARYEPAIGGRGTRITFEGQIGASGAARAALPSFLDGTLLKGFEVLAGSLIPANLRKLTEAVSVYLDAHPPS